MEIADFLFCLVKGRPKKMPKLRTKPRKNSRKGFGPFPRPQSEAARRRTKQMEAERDFPKLKAKIEGIAKGLKENLAKGRFDYLASLEEMFRLVHKWESDDMLDERLQTVADLDGRAPHKGANRFSVLVRACTDRNAQTISRWSLVLEEAFSEEIEPKEFVEFARASSAHRTKIRKKNARRSRGMGGAAS